jgi:hypothetical protein
MFIPRHSPFFPALAGLAVAFSLAACAWQGVKDSNDLAYASAEPKLSELNELYQRCSPVSNGWNRLVENDNVRYAIWAGQSTDGKKWDKNQPDNKPAFPWDGASDCRVLLADEIINDIVDILTESFWRSVARVQGVEASDTERAAYGAKLIEWVKGTKLYSQLQREIELHAQNGLTYGSSLLHITWERELAYKRYEVTLMQLMALAQVQTSGISGGSPVPPGTGSPLAGLPEMILDPSREAEAAQLLADLYLQFVEAERPRNFDWEPKPMSKARARQLVRDLREEGKASVPFPYLCKDQPCITALKMWEDVFVPPETTDIQSARAIFVREWFSEADLQGMVESEGWKQEWVDAAIKEKGNASAWAVKNNDGTAQKLTAEFGYVPQEQNDLIEVIYAYARQVDEDGILGIYYTVFHAKVTTGADQQPLYAKHELLDYAHGKYPFAAYRREISVRQLCASRGVPQVVSTWQRSVKVQEDALTDRTSFETLPPIFKTERMGVKFTFGPAVQNTVQNMATAPKFMERPTGTPTVAFDLMDRIEHRVDRYFGRRREDIPAENSTIKMQKQVRAFLLCCAEAFQQMFQLMEQYMDEKEFQRITGATEPLAADKNEIAGQFDYILTFDVQELSQDFALAKLKAISENILPEDAAGIIDRAKLTKLKLRAIDPSFAGELISSEASASQAIYKQVQTDFALMNLGNDVELTQDDDPTAQTQIQFAEQIVQSNQKYQFALRSDPDFRKRVETWLKNKQFSLQQQQNKTTGRLGVKPMGELG